MRNRACLYAGEAGLMDDDAFIDRAIRSYIARTKCASIPASTSGMFSHDGQRFVVLENISGVLAIYRVSGGRLRWVPDSKREGLVSAWNGEPPRKPVVPERGQLHVLSKKQGAR